MYSEAFKSFLKCTDEKQVFIDTILTYIDEYSVNSLLDIGAGNGDLSIPVAKKVGRYMAIEPDTEHVATLRGAGLNVIEGKFPCPVSEKYDVVLCSHSTPGKPEGFKPFIHEAFNCVDTDGSLLIITYDDAQGAWGQMLDDCNIEWPGFHKGRMALLREFLFTEFKNITEQEIITHVSSNNINEFLEALAFVYTDGKSESEPFTQSPAIREYVQKNYYKNEMYSFPFTHYLFEIKNR